MPNKPINLCVCGMGVGVEWGRRPGAEMGEVINHRCKLETPIELMELRRLTSTLSYVAPSL